MRKVLILVLGMLAAPRPGAFGQPYGTTNGSTDGTSNGTSNGSVNLNGRGADDLLGTGPQTHTEPASTDPPPMKLTPRQLATSQGGAALSSVMGQLQKIANNTELSVEDRRAASQAVIKGLQTGDPAADKLLQQYCAQAFAQLVARQQASQAAGGALTGVVGPGGMVGPAHNQPGTALPAGTAPSGATTQPPEGQGPEAVLGDLTQYGKNVDPKNPVFYSLSGEQDMRLGRFDDAYSDYGKAIELGANDKKTLTGFGSAAHQLGDMDTAAKMAQKVLELDPNDQKAMSLYNLSAGRENSARMGSAAEAAGAAGGDGAGSAASGMTAAQIVAAAMRQGAEGPNSVQKSASLTREAASALGVRDFSEAIAKATQAIEQNPRNAQAYNYRAIADNKLQRYKDAVQDASAALGLAPGNSPALQSRSWALSKQQRFKEGLADASAILESEPDNAFAYQNRALAFAGLGDRARMLESLKKSAELDPRFSDRYQKALQAPQNADVMFLFDEAPAAQKGAASIPGIPKKKRFLMLSMTSLVGGGLVALGLLHIFSATWREKVRTTMRKVVGGDAIVADATPAPESGGAAVWGQYELVREIGTGGMGVVYEAKDKSLERTVAVKKMREEIRIDPRERARFMTEAKTVAALHHPNIVDIYSIIEDAGDVFLVFEYVQGKNLSDVIREGGPLTFDGARKILKCACDAVEYAHKHKVIHRDLKPSNIMVTGAGEAKVMDFGVARQAQDAMSKALMTNTVVGTPPYMAPEQEQGTVRPESDVYALGIVLYEMLSGKLPFAGQGAGMLLNKINGKFIPLSESVQNGLPLGLDQVMAKALNPDPEKRYRTASELLAAVDALGVAKAG